LHNGELNYFLFGTAYSYFSVDADLSTCVNLCLGSE